MNYKVGDRVIFDDHQGLVMETNVVDVDAELHLVQIDSGPTGWTHEDWLAPAK